MPVLMLMSPKPMRMAFSLTAAGVLMTFRLDNYRHNQKMVADGHCDPGDGAAEERREKDTPDNAPRHRRRAPSRQWQGNAIPCRTSCAALCSASGAKPPHDHEGPEQQGHRHAGHGRPRHRGDTGLGAFGDCKKPGHHSSPSVVRSSRSRQDLDASLVPRFTCRRALRNVVDPDEWIEGPDHPFDLCHPAFGRQVDPVDQNDVGEDDPIPVFVAPGQIPQNVRAGRSGDRKHRGWRSGIAESSPGDRNVGNFRLELGVDLLESSLAGAWTCNSAYENHRLPHGAQPGSKAYRSVRLKTTAPARLFDRRRTLPVPRRRSAPSFAESVCKRQITSWTLGNNPLMASEPVRPGEGPARRSRTSRRLRSLRLRPGFRAPFQRQPPPNRRSRPPRP